MRNPRVTHTRRFPPGFIERFWRAKGFFFVGQRTDGIEIQLGKATTTVIEQNQNRERSDQLRIHLKSWG